MKAKSLIVIILLTLLTSCGPQPALPTEQPVVTETPLASLPSLQASPTPAPAQASREVFDFIEGWYNPHRWHSSIDYLSPSQFERADAHQIRSQA